MRRARITALAFSAWLAACDDGSKPLEPVWNKQACDHCHMLLSEKAYAAQLVTNAGARLYFDDVGCLAAYMNASAERERAAWVHGPTSWLPAREAHFSAGAQTPMGFGFAADPAGPLDFATVLSRVSEKTGPSR
jgi:copper chaperone NosL